MFDAVSPARTSSLPAFLLRYARRLGFLTTLILATSLASCGGGSGDDSEGSLSAQSAQSSTEPRKFAAAAPFTDQSTGNGWYWNPQEGGTGFMFEAQGNRAFVAFFMYEEVTGMPIWYAAYGDLVPGPAVGEMVFSGDLRVYRGGQAVSSALYASPTSTSVGPVGITFANGRAQVALPGGRTIDAQRYVIDGSGYDFANPVAPQRHQPEVGWFWNPAEGGRGYAFEVQNGKVFMAMFHYNPDGSPTWNVVQGDIATGATVRPFELYTGGQSLTSGYRGPNRDDLSSFTLSFRNPCAGQMQLAGAPAVAVRRFRIDGTQRSPGAECNAISNGVHRNSPGLQTGGPVMEPGDVVFGRIEVAGETYSHGYRLEAGHTYTATLAGAEAGAGTLVNPALTVHDASLIEQSVARQAANTFRFTPGISGIYYFAARASGAETGYYVLSVSGTAAALSSQVAADPSAFAGSYAGTLSGKGTGNLMFTIGSNGQINGSLRMAGNLAAEMAVWGNVYAGGALTFYAAGGGDTFSFTGFMAPSGVYFGTWSDGQGLGGMFRGSRGNSLPPNINTAPAAIAGLPQSVTVGATVNLNGSSSSDPQGDPLTFAWTLLSRPAGSAAALTTPSSPQASFVADVAGTYVIGLIVSDGQLSSSQYLVTVTAESAPVAVNTAPIANAGVSQTVAVGTIVSLSGQSSYDPDGDVLSFSWTLNGPVGSSAALSDPTSVSPTFVPDIVGTYSLNLTVSDGRLLSSQATVLVEATYQPAPEILVLRGASGIVDLSLSRAFENSRIAWSVDGIPIGEGLTARHMFHRRYADYNLEAKITGGTGIVLAIARRTLTYGPTFGQLLIEWPNILVRYSGQVNVSVAVNGQSIGSLTRANYRIPAGLCGSTIVEICYNSFRFTAPTLPSGAIRIDVMSLDQQGISSTESFTIVHVNPPILTVEYPTDGQVVSRSLVLIGSSESDLGNPVRTTASIFPAYGISTVLVTTEPTFNVTKSLEGYGRGQYEVIINASDRFGSRTQVRRRIVLQ